VVAAANLNSPDQIVIAGQAGAVNRAMELAKARRQAGGLVACERSVPLSLMKPAQERLARI